MGSVIVEVVGFQGQRSEPGVKCDEAPPPGT